MKCPSTISTILLVLISMCILFCGSQQTLFFLWCIISPCCVVTQSSTGSSCFEKHLRNKCAFVFQLTPSWTWNASFYNSWGDLNHNVTQLNCDRNMSKATGVHHRYSVRRVSWDIRIVIRALMNTNCVHVLMLYISFVWTSLWKHRVLIKGNKSTSCDRAF